MQNMQLLQQDEVPCTEKRQWSIFKDIGTVIYLEVDEIELEERVGSLKERGVVSNGKTTIDEIFEDRKNLYRKYADITLNLNGKSIRESVDDIYDNLINKDSNY